MKGLGTHAVENERADEIGELFILRRRRPEARKALHHSHEGLRKQLWRNLRPKEPGRLLRTKVVRNLRTERCLEIFSRRRLREADLRKVGVGPQDGKQFVYGQPHARVDRGCRYVGADQRLADGILQPATEQRDQFVICRLFTEKIEVENRLADTRTSNNVADARGHESVFGEFHTARCQ